MKPCVSPRCVTGYAREGRGRDRRADAGHDPRLDAGVQAGEELLAAAAEDEVVAALEPDDVLAGLGVLDEELVDLVLARRPAAGDLGDVDDLGVGAGPGQGGQGREPVGDDDVGGLDRLAAGDRHEAGIAGAAADQRHGAAVEDAVGRRAVGVLGEDDAGLLDVGHLGLARVPGDESAVGEVLDRRRGRRGDDGDDGAGAHQGRDLGGGSGVAADHEGGGSGGQVHGPSIRSVARSLRVVSGLRTAMRTQVSSRPGNVSARRTA